MAKTILKSIENSNFDKILIPGFVQWDTRNLEDELSVEIRKGPEFASDLPMILKNINKIL